MAFKVVVSNKADSYQVEVDDTKALNGLVIGDEFVMFSSVTKKGKDEIEQKIERTI